MRRAIAITALAAAVGCGGGSQAGNAAIAGASLAIAAAHVAARRAAHECFTPCTHGTHCDPASGLCVPGAADGDPDPDLAAPRTAFQMARAVADAQSSEPAVQRASIAPPEIEPSSGFDCDVCDGSRQTVQASSAEGAREVCLAWNDVDPSGPACACSAAR